MVKTTDAQAQVSFPVRLLSALYGSAERVPSWAHKAWATGWRPVLRKDPTIEEACAQAHNEEEVNTHGK